MLLFRWQLFLQAGIAEPGILRKVGLPGYFAPEKDMMTEKTDRAAGDCAGREAAPQGIFSDLPKDLSIHIPGCADAPMALRSDGVMAVMDRGNIRIYDWKRRRKAVCGEHMDFGRWTRVRASGIAGMRGRVPFREPASQPAPSAD